MKTANLVVMVLALFLAGCGGGGGGGGVDVPVTVPPVGPDEIRPVSTNPHGFDPRETWENAEAYLESLALEPASENSRTIGGHEYTAVGEKGDISYGQAKAGPTDTLDIDFIGDHWNELPQENCLKSCKVCWSVEDNLVFEAIVEGERASTPLPLEDEFTWQGSLLAVDTENAEPVRGDARIELRAGDLGGTSQVHESSKR